MWLSLLSSPGDRVVGQLVEQWGPVEAVRLLTDSTDPKRALSQLDGAVITPDELARARHRYPVRPGRDDVDDVLRQLSRDQIQLIAPSHPSWPVALDDLGPHRPHVLFVKGDVDRLSDTDKSIAVVGTRRPSIEGARTAAYIAQGLSDAGLTTVSGGALGIDAIVHRGSLRAHTPTVLVAATALNRAYPREHRGLFDTIARRGVLVSETPPNRSITPASFLARNRIIAALASQTIVVECPAQSGALSTASHAATLGRVLWAVEYAVSRASNEGQQRLFDEWGAKQLHVLGPGHETSSVVNAALDALAV